MQTYRADDVILDIVAWGVGEPSENDQDLAELFNGKILWVDFFFFQFMKSL